MRVVIQRVKRASVKVKGKIISTIGPGILVLAGIEQTDTEEDAAWLAGKLTRMRLFNDEKGVMNRDVNEINGEILLVSQFTLHANTKKGNRPSYLRAARSEFALPLFSYLVSEVGKNCHNQVKSGSFGAMMDVELINDGPVTIIIDTKLRE